MIPFQATGNSGGAGAPYLRSSMDADSRISDTELYRLGTEFGFDRLTGAVEVSHTKATSVNPNLSLTLNFINPNSYRDGTRDENGIPVKFDFSKGTLAFGIDMDSIYAPTTEMLLDPQNYLIDNGGTLSANERHNKDDAFRADFKYDLSTAFITTVDFGYRYNESNSIRDDITGTIAGTNTFANKTNGSFFADLLRPIPDNFGDGTGSDLFVKDMLALNPELARNPESFIASINAAYAASGKSDPVISTAKTSSIGAYYDITESTNALYAQANFEAGIVRGNVGARYFETDVETISYGRTFDPTTGAATNGKLTISNKYDAILPRVNVIVDLTDDIVLRAAYSEDINRPDFSDLTSGRTLPGSGGVNDVARIGNPYLKPEEVESFDISAEWYFAPAAIASIGYFEKTRSNLFGDSVDQPGIVNGGREIVDKFGLGGADRTTSTDGAPCALGGVFSDATQPGIFAQTGQNGSTPGVCVGEATRSNVEGETKQSGIELALQYSLGDFEDTLGWASGFGFIANYTRQKADVDTGYVAINDSRAVAIYAAQGFNATTNPVSREGASLLNLSEDSYNFTLFYEKYGFTSRIRYTYRDAYLTSNLPGTSNLYDPMGFRAVVEARSQVNASINYEVTDNVTFSLDGINLTESDMPISCINEGAMLCYQGITDRRIIAGASYKF